MSIIEQAKDPDFWDNVRYDNTFSDLLEYAKKCNNQPELRVLHIYVPFGATEEQVELAKKICGKI